MNWCHTSTKTKHIYLGGVLFQHADGLWVNGRGLCLQVCYGAISLDGQDGVGLGHVHCVLDVGGAPIFQLYLLQAALVVCICTEMRRRMQRLKLIEETGLCSSKNQSRREVIVSSMSVSKLNVS